MTSIITEEFLSKYKNKQPKWGYNGLGYVIYKRTYARPLDNFYRTEEWYETVSRCINGAQEIGANYTQEEAERLYDYIFNLKCSYAGRMLWMLGTEYIKKWGGNALCNCLAYETEIYTSSGIKQIGELVNQKVEVMTEFGKIVEAEIKSFGKQKLFKISLNKRNSQKTIFATSNHRWFRRPYRKEEKEGFNKKIEVSTIDLKIGDKLISTYGQSINNVCLSDYGIIHGIVYGDGSRWNNKGFIGLCGNKNKELLKYFFKPKCSNLDKDIIRISELPSYFKDKPKIFMDKSYLYGWLAGYFAADGCISKEGQVTISSSNIYFVRDVCIKLGIECFSVRNQFRKGFGKKKSLLYTIGINGYDLTSSFFLLKEHKKRFLSMKYDKHDRWVVKNVEGTDRNEEVYCAIVPKTHSFVLADNILTGNCFFITITEPEDFCFIFENLMMGGGVGYSVRREDVHELPKIKEGVEIIHQLTKDADFIVPDSREGWVYLLRKVLKAYFTKGKSFTYSTILIRGYGEKIHGLGGTASGPQILVEGIENICKIFKSREGKKLRSIDVLDIANIIASIVISGNLRRSASIALGDPDDYLFLRAKRWDLGNVPNWRSLSNNTIYADDFTHIQNDVWEGFQGNGEPYGLFNLPLARKYGRIGEIVKDDIEGQNPCGEVSLPSGGVCCLSELFLNNITSKEELIDCAKLLYKTQKAICSLKYIHDKTNKVVHRDYRIGISVTGICQSFSKLDWLDETYKELKKFDKEWSKKNNLPESIKLTTCKPSGTISLLSGSTPGVHPAYSKYYIRRVRMSSNDPLIEQCKKIGYKIECVKGFDGVIDTRTMIVEFPCFSGEDTILAKDMSAINQLDLIKKMQKIWADLSVSCTVYYKKEELSEIKKWLKDNYTNSIKSVSFLLHQDHGFEQAPYEEITKEKYDELISKVKPLTDLIIKSGELENLECSKGSCPIK